MKYAPICPVCGNRGPCNACKKQEANQRHPLGKLASISDAVDSLGWPRHTSATRKMLKNLLVRMAEIDKQITASTYNSGDDAKDRPPTGDDYNLLWDAILDEINAVVVVS